MYQRDLWINRLYFDIPTTTIIFTTCIIRTTTTTISEFLEPFQPPQAALPPSNFIGISPAPSAPPLVPENSYLLGSTSRTTPNNLYGYQTQTWTRKREEVKDAVQKELDDNIYELPDDPPKHELRVDFANLLGPGAEDI